MDYTVVMVRAGNDPAGLAYIAPYAATSVAEHFMEQGRDVLIVYDDLTNHARAYRELSLLLRRPPGREAFPGDIFYIHSRLLERATRLMRLARRWLAHRPAHHRDRCAGHFRLHSDQSDLHHGRTAVSVACAVSQLGSAARGRCQQIRLPGGRRGAACRLSGGRGPSEARPTRSSRNSKRSPASGRGWTNTLKTIEHGQRIRACLKQPEFPPVSHGRSDHRATGPDRGTLRPIPLAKVAEAEQALHQATTNLPADLVNRLTSAEKLSDADHKAILDFATRTLLPFQPAPQAKPDPKPESKTEVKSEAKPDPKPSDKTKP